MIRLRISSLVLWSARVACVVTCMAGLYFGVFFAWLTAGPGAPYQRLYARRAEVWLLVTALALVCLILSFVLPRRTSGAARRTDAAARLGS
jgi:hypothetical protein